MTKRRRINEDVSSRRSQGYAGNIYKDAEKVVLKGCIFA